VLRRVSPRVPKPGFITQLKIRVLNKFTSPHAGNYIHSIEEKEFQKRTADECRNGFPRKIGILLFYITQRA